MTAAGEDPAQARPAPIDVTSQEVAPRPAEPLVDAADDDPGQTTPSPPPRPPAPRLEAEQLVAESTRLVVGALVASGRGLRAILERTVAARDDAPPARPGNRSDPPAPDPADHATPQDSDPGTSDEAAGASTSGGEGQPERPPPAALRPPPRSPETILGALPTAAIGAGMQAQREAFAAVDVLRRRYGPSVAWLLEAPVVGGAYRRVRSQVFAWHEAGAAEKEVGAQMAVVSLREVSDEGLGYVFDHLDLNTITHGFDINPLIENLELSDVILSSTGGLATDVLDNVRSQGVTVDDVIARIVNRVFRRRLADLPKGPPGYQAGRGIPQWTNE